MLIAMAGLPGTGKSTIARRLAAELNGIVIDKDVVRAALFPPPALEYTVEQDDLAMTSVYLAAEQILKVKPLLPVVLDGRTFRRQKQVRELTAMMKLAGIVPRFIACVAAEGVIRERLKHDMAAGTHPAGNRTFELYLKLKANAEPLAVPHLTLDTGTTSLEDCVAAAVSYARTG
jgi:adenylylsulfate kinase